MAIGPLKFGMSSTSASQAIDPLRLGMSIVGAAQAGVEQGNKRALQELEFMRRGYERATQEMNDRVRIENMRFQYEILMPLKIAQEKAQIENIRARTMAYNMAKLQNVATENTLLQEASNSVGRLRAANQFVLQYPETKQDIEQNQQDLQQIIQSGDEQIQAQANEQKALLNDNLQKIDDQSLAITKSIYEGRENVRRLLSAIGGTSRDATEIKLLMQAELNRSEEALRKLSESNPKALQYYNMLAAQKTLALLPTNEQKANFLKRISELSFAVDDDFLKKIYDQTTQTEAKSLLSSRGDRNELLKQLKTVQDLKKAAQTSALVEGKKPKDASSYQTLVEVEESLLNELRGLSAVNRVSGTSQSGMESQAEPTASRESATSLPVTEEISSQEIDALTKPMTIGETVMSGVVNVGRAVANIWRMTTAIPAAAIELTSEFAPEPTPENQDIQYPKPVKSWLYIELKNKLQKNRQEGRLGQIPFEEFVRKEKQILQEMAKFDEDTIQLAEINLAINDYNQGKITRDQLKTMLDLKLSANTPLTRQLKTSAMLLTSARMPHKKLPFNEAQLTRLLTDDFSQNPVAQAFVKARQLLSEDSKNDMLDITAIVNQQLGTNYTAKELVAELIDVLEK